MSNQQRILKLIAECDDPERLRNWIDNARRGAQPTIANAAFRRLIAVLAQNEPGTVQYDFWQTIHAFEQILKEERGKTTRLSRTRQKVARVGEVETLKDWAVSTKSTDGFTMLIERNMPELTGEAIVLRHAEKFDDGVVAAARTRLEEAGVNVAALPAASG